MHFKGWRPPFKGGYLAACIVFERGLLKSLPNKCRWGEGVKKGQKTGCVLCTRSHIIIVFMQIFCSIATKNEWQSQFQYWFQYQHLICSFCNIDVNINIWFILFPILVSISISYLSCFQYWFQYQYLNFLIFNNDFNINILFALFAILVPISIS